MIRLTTHPGDGHIRLGDLLEIHVEREHADIEVQAHLRHDAILYAEPVVPWTLDRRLDIWLEAPGRYNVLVRWRRSAEETGSVALDLEVLGEKKSLEPTRIKIRRQILWTPNGFDAATLKRAEDPALRLLETLLHPGQTAYDLGANMGLYSLPMARRVGREGKLYCIEANPLCVPFLRANLAANKLDQAEIVPIAVLDRRETVRFKLSYGSSNVGMTEAAGFYGHKIGHEIHVQAMAFDDLVTELELRPPDFLKIDIEGAEGRALQGMHQTLEQHHPLMIIELHGQGHARAALDELDRHGYSYEDPVSGRRFEDADGACEFLGDSVRQMVARA